jgi:hypothetical protein
MVTDVFEDTAAALMVKAATLLPAGTVTFAGTLALAGLLDQRTDQDNHARQSLTNEASWHRFSPTSRIRGGQGS